MRILKQKLKKVTSISKIFLLLSKREKNLYFSIFITYNFIVFLEMLGVAAVIPVTGIIIGNRNFDEMFVLKDILNF